MTTRKPEATTTQELPFRSLSGYPPLFGALAAAVVAFSWLVGNVDPGATQVIGVVVVLVLAVFTLTGLYMLQPKQAALVTLFGDYKGTDRESGLRWANPFLSQKKISLRARNLNGEKLKVNDKRGNPIEIAAAVVWRVEDSARAAFDVEDYEKYVSVQAEAAVRHLAGQYAYDDADDGSAGVAHEVTLRSSTAEVSHALQEELHERFAAAGIVVEDAKLTHLAYSPEIAGAMLRRQQAEAIISARQKIVHGAVSMVEMALHDLSARNVVQLDDERKAAMVSNLLVVLCAESNVQPVVNAGSLYG